MSFLTRFDFRGSARPSREEVYRIIFQADTQSGKLFDVVLILAILSSVTVVMLDSVPEIAARYHGPLRIAEWIFTILFTAEYAARLWCVESKKKYALSFFRTNRSFCGDSDLSERTDSRRRSSCGGPNS